MPSYRNRPVRFPMERPSRPFTPVTTIDAEAEVDPRDADLAADAPARIWSAVEDLYATGVQPAIFLCVRRRGRIVLNRAIGHARGLSVEEPEPHPVLARPDTPVCIFSASKAITAMLIHLLDDEGLVHIDDRVSEYIPEFSSHGKEWITIRHVLTHRAGIPTVPREHNDPSALSEWDRIIAMLCEAEPVTGAGRRLAYHAITGGFLLGEIVRRVTGMDIRAYLRERILDPLGFDTFDYGIAPGRVPEVARSYATGPRAPWPLSRVPHRSLGLSFEEATALSNEPDFLTGIVPSANIVGTAEEASRFFQLLLDEGELDGVRIFDPRTIRRATNETAYLEMDFSLLLPIRYGVGLMLGNKGISPFGADTPRAFGHLGFINTLCWADPERQIAVGLLTTGKPFVSRHLFAMARLVSTISRACPRTGRR